MKDSFGNETVDLAAQNDAWRDALRRDASNTPSAFEEMREIRDREKIDDINRRRASVDAIEATVLYTPEGGIASPGMLGMLNRSRGIKTSDRGEVDGQIVEAGFNPKTGGYGFMIARQNPDGSMRYEPNEIPESEVYGMVARHPEIDGMDERLGRIRQAAYGRGGEGRSITDSMWAQMAGGYATQRKSLDDELANTMMSMRGGRRGGATGGGYGVPGMESDRVKVEQMRQEGYADRNLNDVIKSISAQNPMFGEMMMKDPEGAAESVRRFYAALHGKPKEPDPKKGEDKVGDIWRFNGDKVPQPAPRPSAQAAKPVGGEAKKPVAEKPGAGADYGLRNDGRTRKGTGYLGELKTADGGVATEYTAQSDAVKVDGKRIDFPTLVPTLTKEEVDLMVNDIIPNKKPIPDGIMQKAVDHAQMRLKDGKSVFANDGEREQAGGAGEISDDELIAKLGGKFKAGRGESRDKWIARLRTIDKRPSFREVVRASSNFTE